MSEGKIDLSDIHPHNYPPMSLAGAGVELERSTTERRFFHKSKVILAALGVLSSHIISREVFVLVSS